MQPIGIFAPAHWGTHCFMLHNYHILAKTILLGLNVYCFYSWAALVAQLVKNKPVKVEDIREMQVPSQGWEDPSEKSGKLTVFLSGEFHRQEVLVGV